MFHVKHRNSQQNRARRVLEEKRGWLMGHTLEQFAAACRTILAREPGVRGRQKVSALLQEVLRDEAFLAAHFNAETPERKVLYEDPELGFCIVAHAFRGVRDGAPHDHGPSWAIYGQARGETLMSEWAVVEAAAPNKPGKVRLARTYTLKPGMTHLYNEGDLHSPRREADCWLIRIEGCNLERVRRLSYQPA
jgi:hypothetical protein